MQFQPSLSLQHDIPIFTYDKNKVIQALRYHFITRKEIKIMIILVNVFAISLWGIVLYGKIQPLAFLAFSVMWFVLMIVFWFYCPAWSIKKQATFQDRLKVSLLEQEFKIENDRGAQSWEWSKFSTWMESPHFFHVYFNSRSFFIIPKNAFTDDEVFDARKILAAKIKRQ
jgi:hypothetical protein